MHAVARCLPLGPVVRRRHGERDDREDRRDMEVLGGDPRAERDDELGDTRRERLAEPSLQQKVELREYEAEDNAPRRCDEQARNHLDYRPFLPRRDRDRCGEDEQGGRVVEQAFALEDRHRPPWKRKLRQHGCRSSGVRRSHDRAERNRSGERHAFPCPRDRCHRRRRQHNRNEREPCQWQPVAPQFARRQIVGRVEQRGRNEQRERQPRLHVDFGHPRQPGHARAREREHRRVRHADVAGDFQKKDCD